jgi:hypothetical protein
MSGPAWVKKNVKGGYGAVSNATDSTATTARQVEVDGTVYRREIQWTFRAPPSSLTPGQEFTITVTGKASVMDKGAPIKLPNAASAGVSAKGLTKVKGELAWADTGAGAGATYVFRVPPGAKGATITFGADWNMGVFAAYHYGDHKQ